MNIKPQPKAEINISIHETDSAERPFYLQTRCDGSDTDIISSLLLAMIGSHRINMLLHVAVARADDPRLEGIGLSSGEFVINPNSPTDEMPC